MRIVSESISNVRASGFALTQAFATTGENDKFDLALPCATWAPMRYAGDGLTVTATPQGADEGLTVFRWRSTSCSLVNILAVDVSNDNTVTSTVNSCRTVSPRTSSGKRGGQLGDRLVLRGGYLWEQGLIGAGCVQRTPALPAASAELTSRRRC